jgi:hypothetical protein
MSDFRGLRDVRPLVLQGGVPRCSWEQCPSYDGKRCSVVGHQPEYICEPAVAKMASDLVRLEQRLESADQWARKLED